MSNPLAVPEEYATKEDILKLAESQRQVIDRVYQMIHDMEAMANFIFIVYDIIPPDLLSKVEAAYKEKYGKDFSMTTN